MPRSFTDHVKLVNKRHGEGKSKCAIIQEYEEYKEFKEEPGVRIQESGGHGAWRVVERGRGSWVVMKRGWSDVGMSSGDHF
jgi:hypothetical protein